MPTEHTFRIDFHITQHGLDLGGTQEIVDSSQMQVDITQQGMHIIATQDIYPTIDDFITFGKWYKGDKGDPGEDGKSAYEIWLEQGHTGTEDDFLEWLKADSAQADWDESNSDDPSYVNNRTHYIDYGDRNQYDIVEYSDDDDIIYGENIINFIFSGNDIPGFADWADVFSKIKENGMFNSHI